VEDNLSISKNEIPEAPVLLVNEEDKEGGSFERIKTPTGEKGKRRLRRGEISRKKGKDEWSSWEKN